MGLDMYLYKCNEEDYLRRKDSEDALRWMFVEAQCEKWERELPLLFKPQMTEEQCAKHKCKLAIFWRKANQIYGWLVDNVGADLNGDVTLVGKEQIVSLRNTCEQVIRDGIGPKGYIRKRVCRRLLPTTEGPYFGDYIYDKDYMDEVRYTLAELNKLIDTTDFEKEVLLFASSW